MSSAEKTPVSLADLARSAAPRHHAVRRAEKVHRSRLSKSFNFPAPPDGTERSGQP